MGRKRHNFSSRLNASISFKETNWVGWPLATQAIFIAVSTISQIVSAEIECCSIFTSLCMAGVFAPPKKIMKKF